MPVVSDHEMARRHAMANAAIDITNAMASHKLTPIEWIKVLTELQVRLAQMGFEQELTEEQPE